MHLSLPKALTPDYQVGSVLPLAVSISRICRSPAAIVMARLRSRSASLIGRLGTQLGTCAWLASEHVSCQLMGTFHVSCQLTNVSCQLASEHVSCQHVASLASENVSCQLTPSQAFVLSAYLTPPRATPELCHSPLSDRHPIVIDVESPESSKKVPPCGSLKDWVGSQTVHNTTEHAVNHLPFHNIVLRFTRGH